MQRIWRVCVTGVIAKYEAATARNRQARQSVAGGEHSEEAKILCRMDLRALKTRRDLDADAVMRSLQGTKIYAKKQAKAYNDGH